MNQEEKKNIAVTALIIGGFVNFFGMYPYRALNCREYYICVYFTAGADYHDSRHDRQRTAEDESVCKGERTA